MPEVSPRRTSAREMWLRIHRPRSAVQTPLTINIICRERKLYLLKMIIFFFYSSTKSFSVFNKSPRKTVLTVGIRFRTRKCLRKNDSRVDRKKKITVNTVTFYGWRGDCKTLVTTGIKKYVAVIRDKIQSPEHVGYVSTIEFGDYYFVAVTVKLTIVFFFPLN